MHFKILLLDDREAIREALKLLLETQPMFQVAADVGTPMQAYEVVDRDELDVVVLSQDLAGVGSSAVTRELIRRQRRLKVLLLAARADEESVREALAAGARGYVLRQQSSSQLFEALGEVARGNVYLAPQISHLLLNDHLRFTRGEPVTAGPCANLSRRERDVFDLLVRGHNNQRISRLLGISTKTVETHRAHVLRKLEMHSLVDLIRFAARHQLPLE
jgi:DNA-binding NarL/FixJ family response regulator